MKNKVLLLPYDPRWKSAFRELQRVYASCLKGLYLSIEHVGSTAIPGLAAKPVLDIDIIVSGPEDVGAVTLQLEKIGYACMGECGVRGRFAFTFAGPQSGEAGGKSMQHNLYVCLADSDSLKNHLAFRNYLRNNRWAVIQYEKIKFLAASLANGNVDAYVSLKSGFIALVLLKAGMGTGTVTTILETNRAFHARRSIRVFDDFSPVIDKSANSTN